MTATSPCQVSSSSSSISREARSVPPHIMYGKGGEAQHTQTACEGGKAIIDVKQLGTTRGTIPSLSLICSSARSCSQLARKPRVSYR